MDIPNAIAAMAKDAPKWQETGGVFKCLVQGCATQGPFGRKAAMAVHMTRIHTLNLDGSPYMGPPKKGEKKEQPQPEEPIKKLEGFADLTSLSGEMTDDEKALTRQQIIILGRKMGAFDAEIEKQRLIIKDAGYKITELEEHKIKVKAFMDQLRGLL